MILVRFKATCQSNKATEMATAFKAVVGATRSLRGVVHFDVARDLTDENSFIATEVFEDREAMQRQEELPEVAGVVELMQSGALASPPEWTIYEIASSESPSM
jgi:quinol monooxygenase YgiN